MSISGLVQAVATSPALAQALADADVARTHELTGPPAVHPFVIAGLAARRPVLVVTATVREAEDARISTDGDFALVPRPDEPSRPAGLFYLHRGQTLLRLVERDGGEAAFEDALVAFAARMGIQ